MTQTDAPKLAWLVEGGIMETGNYSNCIRRKRGAPWGGPRLCSPGPPGTCPMKRVLAGLPLPGKGLKKHMFAEAQTLFWWPSLKWCPRLSVADDSLARQIPHLHNIPEKGKTGWVEAPPPSQIREAGGPGQGLSPPTWHTTQPSQPAPTHHTCLLLSGQAQARGQAPPSPCLPTSRWHPSESTENSSGEWKIITINSTQSQRALLYLILFDGLKKFEVEIVMLLPSWKCAFHWNKIWNK